MTTAAATSRDDETAGTGPRPARPVLRLLGAEAAAELAGHVSTARELERRQEERRRTAFATGLGPLDRLLEGGLPRGTLVELVGRPGSGRFAAALGTLATATAAGEAAALVDLGDHLDPESVLAAGASADRLLWVRPRHVREALVAAETLLNGGFPLVVVDLGTPPVPGGRGQEAGWVRLARAAQTHGAALLVCAPYRVSGTAAHTVVDLRRHRAAYVPTRPTPVRLPHRAAAPPALLSAVEVRLTLEKSRGRNGGDREQAQLLLPETLLPESTPAVPESPSLRSADSPSLSPHRFAGEGAAELPGRGLRGGRTPGGVAEGTGDGAPSSKSERPPTSVRASGSVPRPGSSVAPVPAQASQPPFPRLAEADPAPVS